LPTATTLKSPKKSLVPGLHKLATKPASEAALKQEIKQCVGKQIDLNRTDENGFTALQLACIAGQLGNVKVLVQGLPEDKIDGVGTAGVNAQEAGENRTPLMFAAQVGSFEIVQFLLTCKADITLKDKGGRTAWHYAMHSNSPRKAELVDLLNPESNRVCSGCAIS